MSRKRKPKQQEHTTEFSTARADALAGLAVKGYAIGLDEAGRLVAVAPDETVCLDAWTVAAEMRAIIADPPVFAPPCPTMQ